MLIDHQDRALAEIRRVLRPGGRLSALVWSKPEHNPLFALYIAVVDNLSLEELEAKGSDAFSLADPARYANMLREAGFREIQVQVIPLTFQFSSFETLITWWGPDYYQTLAKLEPEARQRVEAQVRQAVGPFEGAQGIAVPAELLLGVGVK